MCKPNGVSSPELLGATNVKSHDEATTPVPPHEIRHSEFSLEDIAKHNSPKDAYTTVHGIVLDVTAFAKVHPGGDLILLAAGRDATVLFETYHPNLQNGVPKSIAEKYGVGTLKDKNTSYYDWKSGFYPTLKKRVVERLRQKKLSRRGSLEIFIKALLLLSGFWFSLYIMIVSDFYPNAILWSMSMGAFASFVGTCIQHDGNHGAFSRYNFVNKMAGWTLDMIGASAYTWELQHMLGHHPYTNLLDVKDCGDQESDPDVFSSFPLMRMHPAHEASSVHKYQHLYAPFLFALMTLSKVFQQDWQIVFSNKLYHIDATCRYGSIWNLLRFFIMKVITIGYMIVLPCYFHGALRGLVLFAVGHFTCGELLATMFIVNHVIEGVAFAEKNGPNDVDPKEGSSATSYASAVVRSNAVARAPTTAQGCKPMVELQAEVAKQNIKAPEKIVPLNDWAAVQCQTSVNWSAGSWFWNHFSGGLSHQIEHHLFPSICHTNYVYIQDVVETTCREFGVPYRSEPSLMSAYMKMLKHLWYLGNEDEILKKKSE